MNKLYEDILDLAIEICSEKGFTTEIQAVAKKVLASKDPEWNFRFARDIAGADVLAHGQVVIDSKDPEWNFGFARDIAGADVLAHGQVVIDSKNPQLNFRFAHEVKGADIIAHEKISNPLKINLKIEKLNALLEGLQNEQ